MWIASQVLGFIAVALTIWALQIKSKPKMLIIVGIAYIPLAISVGLLLNWVVFSLMTVVVIRSFIFAFIEHRNQRGKQINKWIPFVLMLVFMTAQVVPVVFTWEWWLDWLLLGSSLFITFGNWAKGPHMIRASMASYDILVIVNHVIFFNIAGIVMAALKLGSVAVFYARFIIANQSDKAAVVLAFETSCDETCAAVIKTDGKNSIQVLSNVISSQIDIHKLYGGVVPEIASRNHAMAVLGVCEEALEQAGVTLDGVTKIAAVTKPGLRGAVMVGQVFGESLATARKLPFIPVNHLAGHIASVAIPNEKETDKNSDSTALQKIDFRLSFPFLSLLVSGGHTSLYKVKKWNDIGLLCETSDDAVGECFDKVAKILGLEYPGGVKIEKLAKEYKGELITFVTKPSKKDGFSYSGLKTAVLNFVQKNATGGVGFSLPHICASFQHEAIMQLVDKSVQMMKAHNINTICVCGGVSANGYLREKMTDAVTGLGGRVIFPEMQYCTDNAAMVGMAAILGVEITELSDNP